MILLSETQNIKSGSGSGGLDVLLSDLLHGESQNRF